MNHDTLKISDRRLFNPEDRNIPYADEDLWSITDSDNLIKQLKNVLSDYCLHNDINKYEKREKPLLKESFIK